MKPPRRWLAFLLNLILPPTGYVYVGLVRTAFATFAVLLLAGLLAVAWTVHSPPGVYWDPLRLGAPTTAGLLILVVNLGLAVHAALATRVRPRPTGWRLWVIAAGLVLGSLVLGEAAKRWAPISFYSAASSSMEPSLGEGDIVAVRGARALCGRSRVEPGDVVIYRTTKSPGVPFMHRAVATAGQSVEVRDGQLIVDGRPALLSPTPRRYTTEWGMEAPVFRETLPSGATHEVADLSPDAEGDRFGPQTVPAGHIFVMGDNRDNALDSRFDGTVALSGVCGVVFKVLQSKERARIGLRP